MTITTKRIYTNFEGQAVILTEKEVELVEQLDKTIHEEGMGAYLEELDLSYNMVIARSVINSLVNKDVCTFQESLIGYSMV